MRAFICQGLNGDVDQAAAEDVWPSGGNMVFPAAAAATTIESGDADDAAAGTGARTVKVTGLDNSYNEISEVVTLNGTNVVNMVNQYLRILDIEVLSAGSSLSNEGILSVKHSSTVLATVPALSGRMRAAQFTVPISGSTRYKLIALYGAITNAVAGSATFTLMTRKYGGAWQVRQTLAVYGTSKSSDSLEMDLDLMPCEDVKLSAAASADNTAVIGSFSIVSGSVSELTR